MTAGLYEGFLTKNLDRIRDYYMKRKFDWLNAIDGFERLGKTTLAVKVCQYIDPSFNLDRVCFTPAQYMNAVQNAKRQGQAILYDEAITGLMSSDAQSSVNKTLQKMFAVVGSKRLFHCVVLPNFLKLDKTVAMTRVMSLQHVTWRGRFSFYSRKRASKIAEFRNMKNQYPNFWEKYPGQDSDEFDWKTYEKRKRAHLMDYFKNHGISEEAGTAQIENIVLKVKKDLKRYGTPRKGGVSIDRALLQHDFGLGQINAAKVKKLTELEVNKN
ncbi:MAG: hypothetical protein CMI54_08595 [Parcubacteria group bacterium]|nr:hypothetical protein [Parcubacteria group bacterium]|tara:strand:- start:7466 stop:8275 length:810 start_codon:yes stop_codon:yes gene_type:complete